MMSAMLGSIQRHWPEYLMEAVGLGLFMVSACAFATLLEYPHSPVRQALGDPRVRRVLMGLAMGATNVALIYSPWGKRSGAHFNPAVTLSFLRLGKVARWDAAFYVAAQFAGAVAGVMVAAAMLGPHLADPPVRYAITQPAGYGAGVAFLAEFIIAFLLMSAVLPLSNTARLARFTGLCAAALVATYISVEAPFSGMSLNPARSFAAALPARAWMLLWVYFTAPPLAMADSRGAVSPPTRRCQHLLRKTASSELTALHFLRAPAQSRRRVAACTRVRTPHASGG
jgi:aquaporin Z